MNQTPNVAVVGAGFWGKHHIRNYHKLQALQAACDTDPEELEEVKTNYPNLDLTTDLDQLLNRTDIDGIALVTPAATHYDLAKKILRAEKHLFVEKPLAFSLSNARELVQLAEEKEKQLMTGHIMVYHSVLKNLNERIQNRELGDLNYVYSKRANLGTVRHDANVLWNLSIHDVAVMNEIIESDPVKVSSSGQDFLQDGVADVAFTTIRYESGQLAHLHASWLDPHKVRKMTFVGSDKMAVFNDENPNHQLAIHNKGVEANGEEKPEEQFPAYFDTYQDETLLPGIQKKEPLYVECKAFLKAIKTNTPAPTDGEHALDVIRILEAADYSLERDGETIEI